MCVYIKNVRENRETEMYDVIYESRGEEGLVYFVKTLK